MQMRMQVEMAKFQGAGQIFSAPTLGMQGGGMQTAMTAGQTYTYGENGELIPKFWSSRRENLNGELIPKFWSLVWTRTENLNVYVILKQKRIWIFEECQFN